MYMRSVIYLRYFSILDLRNAPRLFVLYKKANKNQIVTHFTDRNVRNKSKKKCELIIRSKAFCLRGFAGPPWLTGLSHTDNPL